MIYSSLDNQKIKELKKLQMKKYRLLNKLFLVEGEHLVNEAYKAGLLVELIVLEGQTFNLDVNISYVALNVMNYLSELENSKVIGVCRIKENEIKGNKIVLLDNIQDPGNLGTIIRSCVAFSIDTLILVNCVSQYNSKVLRAAQGLNFYLNIVNSSYSILDKLKNNYRIIGTRLNEAKELKNVAKYEKFVIIMGNEGTGISNLSKSMCDEYIYIPMNNNCESLNVGVATSIILYEMNR
jgi:TrmH family RNA methyltransferase